MSLKIELMCPKHPKYNPLQGEDGIKGGCLGCYQLVADWRWLIKEKEKIYKWKGVMVQEEAEEIRRKVGQLEGRVRQMRYQMERDEDLAEMDLRILGALD